MRNFLVWSTVSILSLVSCQSLLGPKNPGAIVVNFGDVIVQTETKAAVPDKDDFIMKVCDSGGNAVYSGLYGASPENLIVSPGTYTVQVWSCEFTSPLFDTPQYGDTEVVVVKEGETCNVTMYCSQVNSGVHINVHPDFLSEYPKGVLYLKSSSGKLMYSFSEKRIAYFLPGAVSLVLNDDGAESTLFTRTLLARQVLDVNLTVASSGTESSTKGGVSIQIDTARDWLSTSFELGASTPGGGTDVSNAYSVSEAKQHIGETDVWVYGFIVGGDLSSSRCSFEAPFSSRTNVVIAARSSCKDKESCLSVQLAKGDARDDINLVDHPDNLGKKVYLYGDIVEAYYGIPGVQCITGYEFK